MPVLLLAYVCMLTAFETLSLLENLVNKESESESESLCARKKPRNVTVGGYDESTGNACGKTARSKNV